VVAARAQIREPRALGPVGGLLVTSERCDSITQAMPGVVPATEIVLPNVSSRLETLADISATIRCRSENAQQLSVKQLP